MLTTFPRIITLGVLAALGFTITAHADLLADIRAKGKIVAVTNTGYPPFDILSKDGEYTGLDRDLFDAIAKELDVGVEYIDVAWTGTLAGLEAGKFDVVVTAVAITAERMKRWAFTLPIADGTPMLIKRVGDDRIASPVDMAGKIAGCQQGTAEYLALEALSKTLPQAIDVRGYVTLNDALADLAVGRLDAVADGAPLVSYAAAQRPELYQIITPTFGKAQYYAYVTRAGEETASLVSAISASLLKMHEDGRFDAINKKWGLGAGVGSKLPTTMPRLE